MSDLGRYRETDFKLADLHRQAAVEALGRQVKLYQASDLPYHVRMARVDTLMAKIDAFNAIRLDPDAHPWSEDDA